MMEHTKEPWVVGSIIEDYPDQDDESWAGAADGAIEITWNAGAPIAYVCLDERMQANARRIVACVNACEGIPSDNVLFTKFGSVRKLIVQQELEIVALKDTRDQLLSSLKSALAWIDAVPSDMQLPAMPGFDRDELDNLIAKIEGEK